MTPTLDPKALEAAWHASLTEYDASDLFKRMNAGWSAQQALERLMQDAVPAAVSAYLAATPSNELWIGEYMLRRGPTNGIWIGRKGGEGGQFATDDVERVIAEFYRENF